MERQSGELFLGGEISQDTGDRTDRMLIHEARRLTTHGVIVGMTGSGKTGLGLILLEEALLSGVPVFVIDPKGDMGNLLLNFPDFATGDFLPWVDPAEADREGIAVETLAERTAEHWRSGLEGWGVTPDQMRALRDGSRATIYTPGSNAGVPLNLIGSLVAPNLDWSTHAETLRDEIEGLVSSLLTLSGSRPDPVSDPEHILLATLIERAWRKGEDLDLATLIGSVQRPPIRKLGVFPIDDFFPPKERTALAMRLNGLVASPSFANWLEGHPLDIPALLRAPDGRPAASIFHLAHLSDPERQFVVTLLLTRIVTWMRQQPGTSGLRALIYMDEMFGFAPPTANPPSKKSILTIFKQARAHGVGMVVATQNPVDLDYKTISNAGTWLVGRLQTERDKARILEGLKSSSGGEDLSEVDARIGALEKRQFLLRSARDPEPKLFTTRWAISYLRGALTRDEISRLTTQDEAGGPTPVETSTATAPSAEPAPQSKEVERTDSGTDDETPVAPQVPERVPVFYLDPAAPWADDVGATSGGSRLRATLVARVRLRFDDRYAEVDHEEIWEAVYTPLEKTFDPSEAITVDYDARDLREDAPEGARYVLPAAPITAASYFRDAEVAIKEHLFRERSIHVLKNVALKLYSRVGERGGAFRLRCEAAADALADERTAKLEQTYGARIDRVRDALSRAESRVRELEVDVQERRQQEMVAGAGRLVSMFLEGKGSARSLSGFASRRSMTRRTRERLHTAVDRLEDQEEEIQELEDELARELEGIMAETDKMARTVEAVEIPLEKTDIHVDQVALCWIPTK